MKPELQEKLYAKYPKMFAERKLDVIHTAMVWGVCVDDGWYEIIDTLCETLQFNTDKNDYPQVVFKQIKEKYGTLRVSYVAYPPDKKQKFMEKFIVVACKTLNWFAQRLWYLGLVDGEYKDIHIGNYEHELGCIDGMIDFAQVMSATICEECGEAGKMSHRGSWMKTVCLKHRNECGYKACDEDEEWMMGINE